METLLRAEEQGDVFTPTPREMAEGLGLDYDRIPEWIRMGELAEMLGLSHQSIQQAKDRGTLSVCEDPESLGTTWTGGMWGRYKYWLDRDEGLRWAYYRGTEGMCGMRPPLPGTKAAQHALSREDRAAWEAALKRRRKKRMRS